jgi:hypothetical protein
MKSAPGAETKMNAGKLAVAGMLGVALALAGFAWWWNWQRTLRTLEFYGGEGANLIRTAEKVEGLSLSGFYDAESVEQLEIGPHALEVVGRVDLSKVKGLVHARTALLDDGSYQWDEQTASNCQPAMLYAVRFVRGGKEITLAFDFGCNEVWVVESQRHVTLAPKIATGWQSFLSRHMSPAAEAASR